MKQSIESRFWPKVVKTESCWLWIGSKSRDGYGNFSVNRRCVIVHRWAYSHFVGPIPPGLTIDHICRVRHCVNTAHMDVVTMEENLARGVTARGAACRNGHPRTPESTRTRADGRRDCRECNRIAVRAYKKRRVARETP